MYTNIFDRISFWSLFLTIVLLPIFFLPFTAIPVETTKGLFVVLGLLVTIVFWAMGRFSDGKVVIPKSPVLLAGLGVVFVFLISALFSKSSGVAMFGTMFDVGTFYFMLAGFLLLLCSAIIFRDSKKLGILFLGFVLSVLVLLVFQSFYLFFPKILGMKVLADRTDTLLGSWRALGFLSGLFSLSALFIIEFFSVSKVMKLVLGFFLLLGLVFVALVSSSTFSVVWGLVGCFALVIFVYKASIGGGDESVENKRIHFPVISFVVVTVAILFFMSGQFFGSFLSNRLGIVNNEASPSLRGTMLITKSVLQKNPILGTGPNTFGNDWALYKSKDINKYPVWDTVFNSGSGFLPTMVATTGYLGILSLVIFFLFFLLSGVQSIFSNTKKAVNYKLLALFVVALYLFTASFFYSTGSVLILLAFVFTGVFIGMSSGGHSSGEVTFSFLNDHRKSFFFMFLLIFIMIGSIVCSFKYGERFASVVYFEKAVYAKDITSRESYIGKAVSLYPNDLYLRTYAQIYLLKLNILAQKSSATLTDKDKADISSSMEQAVAGAQSATVYDPKNYLNFQTLGSVYQNLASYGKKDVNPKAFDAFQSASSLNPMNPRLKLSMALVASTKEDAKKYMDEALALKPDYVDALVILSKTAQSEGDTTKAISYAEQALSIIPDNKDLQQYVATLKNSTSANTQKSKDASTAKTTKTTTKTKTP